MSLKNAWQRLPAPVKKEDTPVVENTPYASRLGALLNRQGAVTPPVREVQHVPVSSIKDIPEDTFYGRVLLHDVTRISAQSIAHLLKHPVYPPVDVSRLTFIDTETTGLAGGVGTLAFLIGWAGVHEGRVCEQQLFLHQPGAEKPLLEALSERLKKAPVLVSYNGTSFDWPLLQSRYVMCRMPVPQIQGHIDLRHVCRRVFSDPHVLRYTLRAMEEHVLHVRRHNDVEGADIPYVYREYLRMGQHPWMGRVKQHHRHDIWALLALLCAVCERCAAPVETLSEVGCEALVRDMLRRKKPLDAWRYAQWLPGGHPWVSHVHGVCACYYERVLGDIPRALWHAERAFLGESAGRNARRCVRLKAKATQIRS
jgi:uncharacterized protein YprB with RNaseH-like and TPR domain